MRLFTPTSAATAALIATFAAPAAVAQNVAVLTPYLSAVATHEMVESFRADAEGRGWTVSVIDTAGDIGALASRIDDVVSAAADAIVLVSINPAQVQDQVNGADGAGVPVFAIDGAAGEGVTLNVTSDNYVLGATMTGFLLDTLGDEARIVRFYHSAHPGVRQREIALDDALAERPGVAEVAGHYVQVPGQIDDSRNAMESMLAANPEPGAITGVWAAWDEPALGALLALEAAGRTDILVAGIDGNPQAIELIGQCTPLIATVRQGFAEMAQIAADQMAAVLAGEAPEAPELYAPVELITRQSLGVTCP